jgi:hypothetical protein
MNVEQTSMINIRASTIEPSQLTIKIKIVYLCLVGGERIEEKMRVSSHARASYNTCSEVLCESVKWAIQL